MRFEIERARRLYEVADEGMGYIPRGRRFPVIVARELYAAILDRIEAHGLRRLLPQGAGLAAGKTRWSPPSARPATPAR